MLTDDALVDLIRRHWEWQDLALHTSPQGVNSLTRTVNVRGDRFVVHARPNSSVTFEHRTLAQLASSGLPFALPLPVPTIVGATWVEADGLVVTVTRWISGHPPEENNLVETEACGRALALLDVSLALVHGSEVPAATDFDGFASLPRQVIHRDFDQSNVLIENGRVSGILDFEFCGVDLRVLDFAYALSQWPGTLRGTGAEWPVIAAFARGYRSTLRLSEAEIDSIPEVMRRRWASTLAFRQARVAEGRVTQADLLAEVDELAEAERWLARHEDELRSVCRGD